MTVTIYRAMIGVHEERRLWSAVLMRAFLDLTDPHAASHDRHTVLLWFASDHHDPGSFLWICDQLKLDASLLRQRALEMADGLVRQVVM